jgi:hypothetical protein
MLRPAGNECLPSGSRCFREQENGNSFDDRVTMTARADQVPVSFFENLVIPRADQELQQFPVQSGIDCRVPVRQLGHLRRNYRSLVLASRWD